MSTALQSTGEWIKSKDFFATSVNLTYKGEGSHNSFCGGCVTVLVVLIIFFQSFGAFNDAVGNPEYSQLATTYNYDYAPYRQKSEAMAATEYEYGRQIEVDMRENIVSYSFFAVAPLSTYSKLRVVFKAGTE